MKNSKILLLSLLFACVGTAKAAPLTIVGTTNVTTLADITGNNRNIYIISSQDGNRGALYAKTDNMKVGKCGPSTHGGVYNSDDDVSVNAKNTLQQFAFITFDGHTYMYSVGGKALCTVSSDNNNRQLALSDDVAEILTITTADVSGTTFFYLNFGNKRISFSNGSDNFNAVRLNREGENGYNDEGNRMQLAKVVEDGEAVQLSDEDYMKAMTLVMQNETRNNTNRVGYPQATEGNALMESLRPLVTSDAEDALTTFEDHINDYVASDKVNLPVSGKAYRIKAKYNDNTTPFRYLVYDENDADLITFATTTPTDYNSVFICKQITENSFAFVNNSGKYFVYFSDSQNNIGGEKKGFVDSYTTNNKNAALNLVHLMTQNHTTPQDVTEQCFGSLSIQGVNSGGASFYLMAGDANFHSGGNNLVGFSNNRSSFFYFEEADYPNTPTMNTATGLEDNPQRIATFSAPFATVVPTGVEAYIVTATSADKATLIQFTTEDARAIPANTGVLLYGNTDDATMLPATTEKLAVIEEDENKLGHSAGAALSLDNVAGAYIFGLPQNSEKVGFYLCSGGTLGMNKAYLQLENGTDAPLLSLSFGKVTGIEAANVASADAVAATYDLRGRRVNAITKGGVYIVGGKKIMVK